MKINIRGEKMNNTSNADKSKPIYKFDFGNGNPSPGYIKITDKTTYTSLTGYGFADITKVSAVKRNGQATLKSEYCTFKDTSFEIDLPCGMYEVKILVGDEEEGACLGVCAQDSLPVVCPGPNPPAGLFTSTGFIITVENNHLSLTLTERNKRFSGGINALEISKFTPSNRTIFIEGDSTVASYFSEYFAPQAGWGQMLHKFVPSDITVRNYAVPGMSIKSFTNNKNFDAIMNVIKPNDILLIQWGINDSNSKDPARYSDSATEFKDYLRQHIATAREHGVIPVLVTSQGRRNYDENGKYVSTDRIRYCIAIREVGEELNVPVVDLREKSATFLSNFTAEEAKEFYLWVEAGKYPYTYANGSSDDLHLSEKGATEFAHLVVEELAKMNLIKTDK